MTKQTKSPTMSDVARLAGVSTMTVSRALKSGTSVSESTSKQIRQAADQLGYIINYTAAGLSSRKTGYIAVIIPSINNANFADTLRGMSEHLWGSRLQILLGYTDYDMDREEKIVGQFLSRKPEAIVVTGGSHTAKCRQYLSRSGVPVVEMWDLPQSPINQVVGFSNADAAKIMVRHLFDEGYRKIGFIGGDTRRDTRGLDRRRGFVEAMRMLGLDSSRLVDAGNPPITMREGAIAMRSMLESWSDTEAVMCVSDLSAFGAMTECQRAGLSIPDDIAIAGFGAYDLAEYSIPPITTVDVSAYRIGELIAESIIAQLERSSEEAVEAPTISIEPRLLIRQSTKKA